MDDDSIKQSARLLRKIASGDEAAEPRLFEIVHAELRERAHQLMRRQPVDHTLQTTALVHEAWLKLCRRSEVAPSSRTHFVRLASRAMRTILVDHARARATAKRGGELRAQTLDDAQPAVDVDEDTLLALDEALRKLEDADKQLAAIAELRLFSGLGHEEIAKVLNLSTRTVERAWKESREWLQQHLTRDRNGPA